MLSDTTTRRQLQRLRFLLEASLARTQDQSDVGRHTALVLLDGACENAMGLALGHLGLQSARGFDDKFSVLRKTLDDWKPQTWTSVRQLHDARNLVQHQSILPAGRELSGWAAQAQRFIESLIEAAFAVDLRTVLVAEAIETEDVRHLLVEAEEALGDEDAATAFATAIAGFDAAREAWQGQRNEAIGQLTLQASGFRMLGAEETDPTNRSLLRFEDLLEVQPFAPDVAEYHWLVVRCSEMAQNIAPNLDDAHRAFRFVVAWVLRWEAFAARYEGRRHPPSPSPYEPPVTGARHPVIYNADVEGLQRTGDWLDGPTLENVRYSVKVMLADIPGEERELWARQVGDTLNEIIAARGSHHAVSGNVDARGIVRVHGVAAQATGGEIQEWIREALAEGDQRCRRMLVARQEIATQLPVLRERLEQALTAVDTGQLVAGVTSDERDDGTVWIGVRLQIDESDPMFQHVLDRVVQSLRSGRTGIDYFHTTLWFQTDKEPAAAAALVAAIAADYRQQASARHQGLTEVESRRQALEAELRGTVVIKAPVGPGSCS